MKKNVLLIFIIILVLLFSFSVPSKSSYSYSIDGFNFEIPEAFMNATYRFAFLRFTPTGWQDDHLFTVCFVYSDDIFTLTEDIEFTGSDDRYIVNSNTSFNYYFYSENGSKSQSVLSEYVNSNFISGIVNTNNLDFYFDLDNYKPFLTNFDLKDTNGITIVPITEDNPIVTKNPYFLNTPADLQSGKFENIQINSGNFDIYNDHFYLHTAVVDTSLVPGSSYYMNEKVFILDSESSYKYTGTDSSILHFSVPKSKLGFTLENGKKYIFVLSSSANSLSNLTTEQIFDKKEFTVSGLTTEDNIQDNQDIMNDKLDEQTNAIKENTETNKGIWETIKDILSYINPFSENFFVYKLIELLVDALKSLFIPSDDFLGTYFTDLKEWFSDRLGFLFYPFELVIDILNMILDIDFSEPVFNIPDITEPFSNKKLISATTFKFNDLLENNTFNTIHSIYLVCVDVFVVFGLVNLFRKKYEEVTTK